MRLLLLLCLPWLGGACAENAALPPLTATPDEPPPKPAEPPPVRAGAPEHDTSRCGQVKQLKAQGLDNIVKKQYPQARHDYLRAVELDPADREAPGQLALIDKLTDNQFSSQ